MLGAMRVRWLCILVLGAASLAAQEASGSLAGTVVDQVDSPIPNAKISIAGLSSLQIKTDAVGEFVIAGLVPGTYNLRLESPGFTTKELEAHVEARKGSSLGRVVLQVPPPSPCLGSAKTPLISERKLRNGGKPRVSGGAHVESYGAMRDLTFTLLVAGTSTIVATTGTSENGEFLFEAVKPGNYDVAVSLEASTFATVRNLRVRRGYELDVRLVWEQLPPGQICL
jgi:hypothetical protein